MQERLVWLLAVAAGAILLVAAFWQRPDSGVATGALPDPSAPATPPPRVSQPVRVEVLNGCGKPLIAGRMTKKARAAGMDVIDEGNAESFGFLESVVIDRRGNLTKAREVAAVLGIPRCIQQVRDDPSRLAEVSIVIGRDYRQLRLFDP